MVHGDAWAWADAEAVEYMYYDAVSWAASGPGRGDMVGADETSYAVAAVGDVV